MSGILFVNGRFLRQPLTGVQRYAREVLNSMDSLLDEGKLYTGLHITCLVPPGEIPVTGWNHIQVQRVGRNQNNLWEQMDLPLTLNGRFLFSPTNLGPFLHSNQAVTMHDASVFAVPQAYTRIFRLKYRLGMRLLSRNAQLILTVSEFSQNELAKYLKLPRERFVPIYHGSEHLDSVVADESILDEYRLRQQPYFLVVTSQSQHKNIIGLVKTVRKMNTTVKFVLVGGSYKSVFQNYDFGELPSNIIQLGYTTDSSLAALYKNALALVFPSLYEGFGLPLVEAMHCGCPVICSRIGALQEVAGDAGLYFNPQDPDDIVAVLDGFLSTPTLQATMKQKGLERTASFSWRKTAKKTLDHLLPYMTRSN